MLNCSPNIERYRLIASLTNSALDLKPSREFSMTWSICLSSSFGRVTDELFDFLSLNVSTYYTYIIQAFCGNCFLEITYKLILSPEIEKSKRYLMYCKLNQLMTNEKREKKKSTSVTLPRDLMDEVERFIENSNFGYKSKAEFVKEAIRKYLLLLRDVK